MSSLTELNNYSNNTIAFTDNRPSGVIFDYPTARNISKTLTGTTFTIETLINILDIIKPTTTNVTFEIDVSAVVGATVQWSSLPSGLSVTNVNQVYTVYGINSASDWNSVKTGQIVLPITFLGSFIYNCTINYTEDEIRKTKTWEVGNFLPEANLAASANITCNAQRFRSTEIDLLANATLLQFFYDAQFVSRFTLSEISTVFNFSSASLTSAFEFDLFQPLSNLSNLTYQSNVSNLIFDTSNAYIRDPAAGSSQFDIDFTVSSGVLSQDGGITTSSSITVSGTQSQVNSALENIIYYPNYDFTSTVNLTWSIEKDSTILDSGTAFITHSGEGTLTTNTYTFTSSNSGFTIPYEEIEYGRWEYLVVGGGGGGAAGGGGAGGQVLKGTGTILSHAATFPITVGSAGSRGNYEFNYIFPNNTWSQNAGQGGNSTALGLTAYGGFGGRSNATNYDSSSTTWEFDGGDTRKTDNTSQSGGFGAAVPVYVASKNEQTYAVGAGGGGAGAGQAGNASYITGYFNSDTDIPIYAGGDGGNGVTSSITGVSVYYGGGGGGGGGYVGIDTPLSGYTPQGGLGGGGDGSPNAGVNYQAENGTDGLGGGGGGGNNDSILGPDAWKQPGRGGSGVVILKVTAR